MKSFIYFSLICISLLGISTADNILGIFPHFGYSHFKVFGPILDELAKRGHNITVITYIKSPNNSSNYHELLLSGKDTVNVVDLKDFEPNRSLRSLYDEFWELNDEGQISCETLYKSGYVEHVLEIHKRQPFHLVIVEFFDSDCQLAIPKIMRVPVIGLSSCLLMPFYYDRILLPDVPSHVQSEFIGFPEPLSFEDRFINFLQAKFNKYAYRYITNRYDSALVKKYLNIDFDAHETAKQLTSLIFVNQHFTLTGSRPSNPQLIEIGGIHIKEADARAKLPREIEEFLTSSKDEEIILISWGSMLKASTIEEGKLHEMINALKKSNMRVIWKWESNEIPVEDKSFLFVKWVPQLALLCHPKVKYFWGHAGMLGTLEAFYAGKPMILTPFYGDQFTNAHFVQSRGSGLILEFKDMNEENLQNRIFQIRMPKFAENAKRLSKAFRDRETSALDTAAYWVEYVLRHKEISLKVLQTKAVDLHWFIYHSFDVISVLLFFSIISIYVFYKILKVIFALKNQGKPKRKMKKK